MSVPSTAAGSSMPQWAVMGWPGQMGHVSAAAVSQTVKTKSMTGAPGAANSSQLFDRKSSVRYLYLSSTLRAKGLTAPLGWLPAEKARKRPLPSFLRMLSARIERALLPVHRNRTLNVGSAMSSLLRWAAWGEVRDQRSAHLRA